VPREPDLLSREKIEAPTHYCSGLSNQTEPAMQKTYDACVTLGRAKDLALRYLEVSRCEIIHLRTRTTRNSDLTNAPSQKPRTRRLPRSTPS